MSDNFFDDIDFTPEDDMGDEVLDFNSDEDQMSGEVFQEVAGDVQFATTDFLETLGHDANRDPSLVAERVENQILALLSKGEADVVASLGSTKASTDSALSEKFAGDYQIACGHNSAIKWYSKLASMFPDKFAVKKGELSLQVPNVVYSTAIKPFLGDFDKRHSTASPIVSVVLSLDEASNKAKLNSSIKELEGQQKSKSSDDQGLSADTLDFSELAAETPDPDNNFHVDNNDELGQTSLGDKSIGISLIDFANKSIADYLFENDITDTAAVSEHLANERFAKPRINEIIGIMKYRSVMKTTQGQTVQGNFGMGSTDLDIEV